MTKSIQPNNDPIWTYDLAPIVARATEDHPDLYKDRHEIELELRRYFSLIRGNQQPIAMISQYIDNFWHTFILFSPLYRRFCSEAFGFYADHLPSTEDTPIPEVAIWNFFSSYEERHGPVPDIWFAGMAASTRQSFKRGIVPPNFRWSGWVPPTSAAAKAE